MVESLTETFSRLARASPTRPALTCGETVLSYRDLDIRSREAAARLFACGVSPGMRLGLCGAPTIELFVGMLGILRAGCSYVPLDPQYPIERLRFIAADAELEIVVATSAEAERAAGALGLACVETAGRVRPVAELPSVAGQGEAYVIYTSGSTGKPKGVSVSHGRLAALIQSFADAFSLGETDVWTVAHSFAFDWSVLELWGAWALGGCAVVVAPEVLTRPDLLTDLLVRRRVTVLNISPAAYRAVLAAEMAHPDWLATLRYLIFGSERLDPRTVRDDFSAMTAGGLQMVNLYGITETTVASLFRILDAGDVEGAASPIGGPLPGVEVHIRASCGDADATGMGEIVIGGWGVTGGYIGHASGLMDKFVPEPGSGASPSRLLYRTGDLASMREDGAILYEGRADRQVKVRGFRVEPVEIEAALERHPGVEQAVVALSREHGLGERLVAYYTPAAPVSAESVASLRAAVIASLPSHMAPSAFVAVTDIPLTVNGKIDYDVLPELEGVRPQRGAPYVPPRTRSQTACVWILEDRLELTPIGIDDPIDALGLDSLSATEVAIQCRDAGLALNWSDFADAITVGELAQRAERRAGSARPQAAWRRPAPESVPVTPAQRRMLEVAGMSGGETAESQLNASMLFTVSPDVATAAIAAAVTEAIGRYDSLRLSLDGEAEEGFRVGDPRVTGLETVSVGETTELAAAIASLQEGIAVTDERLFRAVLIRIERDRSRRLLLVGHRLALDGYSIATVARGIAEHVRSGAIGEPCAPYSRWAQALAQRKPDAATEASERYWLSRGWEADDLAVGEWDGVRHGQTSVIETTLAPGIVMRARARGRSLGWRCDELVTWSLASALAGSFQTRALLLAVQRHGRVSLDGLDVRRTPGCFTDDSPVLLRMSGTRESDELLPAAVLGQLREAERHAFDYWWLRGYGSEGETQARLALAPAALAMINYRGRMLTYTSASGEPALTGEPVVGAAEKGPRTAELFGLKLHANESPDGLVLGLRFSTETVAGALAEELLRATAGRIERVACS